MFMNFLRMMISRFLLSFLVLCLLSPAVAQTRQGRVVMNMPGYPFVFELNVGESQAVTRSYHGRTLHRSIKLISVKHFTEPNLWFAGKFAPENYCRAEVTLDVSGTTVTLIHRPYEMPQVVEGLRIFVETTKEWAQHAELADMKDVEKEVRLSLCIADEPWGPYDIVFPINEYRWRSAAYNNTWSSLVPYNLLYYHRGEDFGAIPDRLQVVAPFEGTIIATALPDGDGHSNSIRVRNKDGIVFRLAHMNIESFDKKYVVDSRVNAGTPLAKTGMTWDGRKSQHNDPHCHIEISYGDIKLASFPYLIEAYFRKYHDPVLAIAGGYRFTTAGSAITLDGSRSLPASGERIASYTWTLHDGKQVKSPMATVTYDKPGMYTEELSVTAKNGAEDRDFLQVRVYDPVEATNGLGYGWAYYYPVRNIHPGSEVLFWNRLVNTTDVTIDFGDGSSPQVIDKALTHTYTSRGIYTVTLSGRDAKARPVTVKLEVKVGEGGR